MDNGRTQVMSKDPHTTGKFLAKIWSSEGTKITDPVRNKIHCIPIPTTKEGAQKLIGLFGCWKQHMPLMGIVSKHIYKIARKTGNSDGQRLKRQL